MKQREHADALLSIVESVLKEAVERGQHFEAEQSAELMETGSVPGKDGRQWMTCDRTGEYKMVLTVGPFPELDMTQIKRVYVPPRASLGQA